MRGLVITALLMLVILFGVNILFFSLAAAITNTLVATAVLVFMQNRQRRRG